MGSRFQDDTGVPRHWEEMNFERPRASSGEKGEKGRAMETVQKRLTEKVEPMGDEPCSRKQRHRRFKR